MKVLDRYLVRELIFPILFCSCTLVFLILVADLFDNLDELLRNKTPALIILRYYFSLMPIAFTQTIAWAVWLGTIFLLVNLGLHNELMAMKAAGLKILTIVRPMIFLGLLLGMITFLIADRVVPKTYRTANELLEIYIEKKKNAADKKVFKNVTYYSGGNTLYYFRKFAPKPKTVEDAVIVWLDPETHRTTQKIFAKKGSWQEDHWLFEGITEYQTDVEGDVLGRPQVIAQKTFSEVTVTPRDLVNTASESIFLSYHELKYTIEKLKENGISVYAEEVDLYSRLATPWKGLVMMLLAIPFLGSIRTRKAIALSVLICAGLVFTYHVTDAIMLALGKSGKILPFLSAWGGNIFFATLAFLRLEKANF
ncbi:MAG TPA: LptF/LptG family permease [Candidatus Omnitrophota bacterium]|nr:LptF/LptG family permease [Candidatus Omnitrophota bacterium]HPS37386.1 LptF/LptG family permease [Candidatus Omnitrophota bacterium]